MGYTQIKGRVTQFHLLFTVGDKKRFNRPFISTSVSQYTFDSCDLDWHTCTKDVSPSSRSQCCLNDFIEVQCMSNHGKV